MGSKKKQKEARPVVTDLSAVKVGDNYVVSRGFAETVDLISEGETEGIVSGNYTYRGEANVTGYQQVVFKNYQATGDDSLGNYDLGFLQSIYWNDVALVDEGGFYNFPAINVETVNGSAVGNIPSLNSEMTTYAGVSSSDFLDLSVSRQIGERLYGPEIQGGDATPTDTKPAALKAGVTIDKYSKTYTVLNKELSKIEVNVKIQALFESIQSGPKTYKKSRELKKCRKASTGFGDTKARTIEYNIYYQPIFDIRFEQSTTTSGADVVTPRDTTGDGKWLGPIKETVLGKVDDIYIRKTVIDVSSFNYKETTGFEGWKIRIVRVTPESLTSFLKNMSFVDSIVEIYGTTLRYPYSAMVYSQFDARSFGRIPARAYDTRLIKVKVPNNYNPILKTYGNSSDTNIANRTGCEQVVYSTSEMTWKRNNTGVTMGWDGEFKRTDDDSAPALREGEYVREWTDNPAWCFYDLMTNPRYGLGEYIEEDRIDKWTLYEIAQYCDVLVPDTYGGLEPRFTINYIITTREDAFKVLNDLTSIFLGIAYYANGNVFAVQDKYKDAVYQFNNSNVLDGNFTYSSSSKTARHSVAVVRYNDKKNLFQPAIEYLENEESVRRYGIREIETTALGTTSRGQARRFAQWILSSEAQETETVSFSAGQEGAYIMPGDVIQIYDNFRTSLKYSGRTNAVRPLVPNYTIANAAVVTPVIANNFNSIILDQALNFTSNTLYRFSLLTPTYNTNTGDANEIRRPQIQNLLFSGAHANAITGDYRSDLSGVCTQIYFNTGTAFGGTGNKLDFDNYVITGYTNTGVQTAGNNIPPLLPSEVTSASYSGGCFSGENLIWSIEPNDPNDAEVISGSYSNYKIVNIAENEGTYDISALAYSTGKYDEIYNSANLTSSQATKQPVFATGDSRHTAQHLFYHPTTALGVAKGNAYSTAIGGDEVSYNTIEITLPQAGYSVSILEDANSVGGWNYQILKEEEAPFDINYVIGIQSTGNPLPGLGTLSDDHTYVIPPTEYYNYKDNINTQIIHYTDKDHVEKFDPVDDDGVVTDAFKTVHTEFLIEENTDYYVSVFAVSETNTPSYGMLKKITVSDINIGLSSLVGTVSLTNLATEGITHQPAADGSISYTPSGIESAEPGFEWQSSFQGIWDNEAQNFSIPFPEDILEYRITVREPSSSNVPSENVFIEITGYNTPAANPNFVLQQLYNNPNSVTGYRYDGTVTGWKGNSAIDGWGTMTDDQKDAAGAEWLSVSGSGFNILNQPDRFPRRKFDLVVEAHDGQGHTSAGNRVFSNTLFKGANGYEETWGNTSPNYDILGVSIDAPSGLFFAQITGFPLKTRYISPQTAYNREFPYLAETYVYPNGMLELNINHAQSADGQTISTDVELEEMFNNAAGLVYYYTTGNNQVVFSDSNDVTATSIPRTPKKAPEFNLKLDDLSDPSNTGIVFEIETDGDGNKNAFGGVVQLGNTNTDFCKTANRGYYILNDSDNLSNLKIPFPDISDHLVENMQITLGYFDELHKTSAFESDGITPKYHESAGYKTPLIYRLEGINYSTSVSSDTMYPAAEGQTQDEVIDKEDYQQSFISSPGNSVFVNESSLMGADDEALAYRGWCQIELEAYELNNFLWNTEDGSSEVVSTVWPNGGEMMAEYQRKVEAGEMNSRYLPQFTPMGRYGIQHSPDKTLTIPLSSAHQRNPGTDVIPFKFMSKNLFNPKITITNQSVTKQKGSKTVRGGYHVGGQRMEVEIEGLNLDPEKTSVIITGAVTRDASHTWLMFGSETTAAWTTPIVGATEVTNDSIHVAAFWENKREETKMTGRGGNVVTPYTRHFVFPHKITLQIGILETNE